MAQTASLGSLSGSRVGRFALSVLKPGPLRSPGSERHSAAMRHCGLAARLPVFGLSPESPKGRFAQSPLRWSSRCVLRTHLRPYSNRYVPSVLLRYAPSARHGTASRAASGSIVARHARALPTVAGVSRAVLACGPPR